MSKKKKKDPVVKDNWSLSIGTYPGILFGLRSYEEDLNPNNIPFIDIALELYY